jgi:hypothetical protein
MAYAISYFLPIILRENMGFSIAESQCLAAPPYAFAGILMLCIAWVGDKYHIRGPLLAANALLGLTGLPIMVRPTKNSSIPQLYADGSRASHLSRAYDTLECFSYARAQTRAYRLQ